MEKQPSPGGEILLYENGGEKEFVSVVFQDETFWLTQSGMAELFDCSTDNISLHLKNIYAEEELRPEATTEKISVVRQEGSRQVRRTLEHYNLDAIIAVGYRVNSKKATRFRQWATRTLKEYIQKGFVLNDEMLKNGRPFGRDYFDELLERIREIRASERRAYQKIADVFEQCSYDYDKNSETTRAFYAFVQNKLHFAVTGKTAAELIAERATPDSPTMGLTTWKGAPDGKILKSDTLVAKNYLNEKELSRLNRLVTMFIDYAELMAEDQVPMSMEDWLRETDRFLTNNRRKVLEGRGRISHEAAVKKVGVEDDDIVFCGRQAIDGDTAQVGPQIAEHLNIPNVSYAEEIQVEGDTVTVKRQYEDRYHVVKVKMPCLITALSELNQPRYMTPGGIFDAYRENKVTVWGLNDIEVDTDKIGLKGSPTRVFKSFPKSLKAAGTVVQLDAEDAADYMLEKLREKFII